MLLDSATLPLIQRFNANLVGERSGFGGRYAFCLQSGFSNSQLFFEFELTSRCYLIFEFSSTFSAASWSYLCFSFLYDDFFEAWSYAAGVMTGGDGGDTPAVDDTLSIATTGSPEQMAMVCPPARNIAGLYSCLSLSRTTVSLALQASDSTSRHPVQSVSLTVWWFAHATWKRRRHSVHLTQFLPSKGVGSSQSAQMFVHAIILHNAFFWRG